MKKFLKPRSSKNFVFFIALFVFFLNFFSGNIAAQTLLDPTFNGNGIVTTQYLSFASKAYGSVLQPDGKLVVVGSANTNEAFPGSYQMVVFRYNADGSLDASFDGDGKFTAVADPSRTSEAIGAALQADGKIVVVGRVGTAENLNQDALVVRINPNGSIDTTFDGDGIKTINFDVQNATDIATDVAVQSDGKIVIADRTAASGFQGFIVARLNSDGSFDNNFGTNGSTRIFGNITTGEPRLVLQSDDKIVLSGPSVQNTLVRLDTGGTPDASFGTNGIVNGAGGNGIALQPDGKIVVVNNVSQVNVIVRRYNSDGTPDTSFGTNGAATVTFTNQDGNLKPPFDIALQPDGKIIVGGTVKLSTNPDQDFALVRLNGNGSIDTLFGFNGRLTTNIEGWDIGHSVLVQTDGKIILSGESGGGFSIARYVAATLNNSCRPSADFNGDGKSDPAYFNNSGQWKYMPIIGGGSAAVSWGLGTDRLAHADYNGDCRTDFAVFRNGVWYVRTIDGQEIYYQFGLDGDTPVPADYDGDDLADPAVYRGGIWYIQGTRDGFFAVQFGIASDIPVPGDYDGDGKEDLAIFRDGVWWLFKTTEGVSAFQFGLAGDKPVVGDYDGDGKTDVAVYRPSEGTWYLLKSTEGFAGVQWGISTDRPVPADYDGDGKTDIAVYRNGEWYLLQSTNGFQLVNFGSAADRPVQNAYIP